MDQKLERQALYVQRRRKRKKGWSAFVRAMAMCVVLCTAYVLALPAITLQEQPICGLQDHVHSAECWSQPQATLTMVGLQEKQLFVIYASFGVEMLLCIDVCSEEESLTTILSLVLIRNIVKTLKNCITTVDHIVAVAPDTACNTKS